MTPARSLNDRLFLALTALVVLAPLPLGANRPWSWSLLALVSGGLSLAWVFARLGGYCRPGLDARRLTLPALLFLAALGWGAVQTIPGLPAAWTHPVWPEAAAALELPLDATISGDPEQSGQALMRQLAYGLIFLLAAQLGHQPHRAAAGLKAVALAVLVYGAYALVSQMLNLDTILWLKKWAYHGDATGTFVGRATFGAFAGVGSVVCLALVIRRSTSRLPAIGTGERLERLLARTVPWLVATALLWVAMLASHSRGALLSTAAGSVTLIVAVTVGRLLRPRQGVGLLLVLAVVAAGALLTNGEDTLVRFVGQNELTGDRPNLMRLTWNAIADAPWQGHGIGAFEQTFLPYRDTSLPRPVTYGHAHNSWEETIMDLGWPAGLCLLAAIVLPVLGCCVGLLRRRQHQIYPATAVAVAVLLGSQAIIDFTVQIPALAALFAFVVGIGYSQAWPSRPED